MSGTNQIQKMNTSLSKKVMYSIAWLVKCNTLNNFATTYIVVFSFFHFPEKNYPFLFAKLNPREMHFYWPCCEN